MIPGLITRVLLDHYPSRSVPEITNDMSFDDLGMDPVDVGYLELLITDATGVELGDAIERVETVGELAGLVG